VSRTALVWCSAVLSLSIVLASSATARAQQPGAAESNEAPQFKTPADLDEALRLALEAVRQAEKRGSDFQEKLKEASFYTQAAYQFDPRNRNAKAKFISARMNILVGRSRDAFSQINEYVRSPEGEADPELWEAFRILGDLYFEGGYYVQAETKYTKAKDLNPTDAKIHIGRCRCALKRGGKPREAIGFAQAAIQNDPALPEAHDVYAEALFRNQLLDQARQAIRDAIDRTRTRLRDNPGDTALLAGLVARYQFHQQILKTVIHRDPTAAQAYRDLAQVALEQADIQRMQVMHEVLAILEQGIAATEPNTPSALVHDYAGMLAGVGQLDQAVAALEKQLAVDPADATTQEMLARLKAAGTGDQPAPATPGS